MNKRILKIVLLSLFVIACVGCALGAKHWVDCQRGRCPESVTETDKEEGIRLTLTSPYDRYQVGETIQVHAKLENISDKPVTLISKEEPVFDIEWYEIDANGEVQTHRWSERNPQLVSQSLQLQPGESYEASVSFEPKFEDHYGFQGTWWGRNGRLIIHTLTLGIEYGDATTYGR